MFSLDAAYQVFLSTFHNKVGQILTLQKVHHFDAFVVCLMVAVGHLKSLNLKNL